MRRTIAAIGRTLVTVGLLILLFVVYQLWGTNVLQARAQDNLKDDLQELQDTLVDTPEPEEVTTPVTGPTTTTTPAPLPAFAEKDPVGSIEIPKLGVNQVFVQGTGIESLKRGPGHYASTPMPGQIGNAAIAGHRTTYGAPFNRLDELAVGDEIITTLANGARYVYQVREAPVIVAPGDVWVVANTDKAQLTLTTCNPKYSARQRLVIFADLVVEDSPPPIEFDPESLPDTDTELARSDDPIALEEGLRGERKSLGPAYGFGAVVVLIGAAWWWLFRRWRHPITWLAGVGPFLVFLFVFYVFLERVLPAGY